MLALDPRATAHEYRVGLAPHIQVGAGVRAGFQSRFLHPGVVPTLFHNNHDWRGHHPLEDLLQGTGALATVIAGVLCSLWLTRRTPKGDVTRLVLFWLALLGFLSALPQVVIGTVILRNDVGRAMTHLHFSPEARLLASIVAFLAMPAPDTLSTFTRAGPHSARLRGFSYRRTALHSRDSTDRPVPDSKRHDRSAAAALRGCVDCSRVDSGCGLARACRCNYAALTAVFLAVDCTRLPARILPAGTAARNRLFLKVSRAPRSSATLNSCNSAGRWAPDRRRTHDPGAHRNAYTTLPCAPSSCCCRRSR